MPVGKSVPAEYFVELYRRELDPWNFAASAYEAEKYRTTLRLLPRARYRNACELGCSIGVFTRCWRRAAGACWPSTSPTSRWFTGRRPRPVTR